MNRTQELTRRNFLHSCGVTGAGVLLSGWLGTAPGTRKEEPSEEIGPVEDLMREHGILRRVLLIYEEAADRLEGKRDMPKLLLTRSAEIIRHFIEEYHERLEEKYLFPRFEKSKKLVDLVEVLKKQHIQGQLLTEGILKSPDQKKAAVFIREFIRMYQPHAAREDTVLFPAFHRIVGVKEFEILGDQFEDIEQERFGKEGFEKMVGRVAEIEKALGIYDLSRFTPSMVSD